MPKRKQKRSDSHASVSALPKGAYRLPEGGYVVKPTEHHYVSKRGESRRLIVTGVRREQIDTERLAKVLLAIAGREAEPRS